MGVAKILSNFSQIHTKTNLSYRNSKEGKQFICVQIEAFDNTETLESHSIKQIKILIDKLNCYLL